ncbi:rhomboid family intramembrane serine protease [Bauldia sp.]|uniref:rhomboid family intramembrane serine protease n=1 Tax=Bauldia sp. TaxID=2575872 RepID=UPI003BAD0B7B
MSVPHIQTPPRREPAVNLPGVVVALLLVFAAIHAIREYLLGPTTEAEVLFLFSFIPARVFDPSWYGLLPGAEGARIWSFLTYAFLHADWMHLIFNGLWMAAFGSAVAYRFGTSRFLIYSAAGAIGGSLLHFGVHPDSTVPMVGASAAVSAHMAGAARFVFAGGRSPMAFRQNRSAAAYRYPAPSLADAVRDRRVLTFLGVWFGLNLLFGIFGSNTIASGAIAWEAHIGGFVVGLLLFSLLDPVESR